MTKFEIACRRDNIKSENGSKKIMNVAPYDDYIAGYVMTIEEAASLSKSTIGGLPINADMLTKLGAK